MSREYSSSGRIRSDAIPIIMQRKDRYGGNLSKMELRPRERPEAVVMLADIPSFHGQTCIVKTPCSRCVVRWRAAH